MKNLTYIIIAALALAGCSQRTHDMPSSSMAPSIPAGSKITIDYSAYETTTPARFDIVAFHPPSQPTAIFIFRAIGLPGENVTLSDTAVLINGKEVSPPNGLQYFPMASGINQTNLNSTQFFLLGDNTTNARDSRYLGPIEQTNIIGKVIKIEPKH